MSDTPKSHGHSHGHSHAHSHAHSTSTPEFPMFSMLAHKIFAFDTLKNTLLAVVAVTAITQLLIAASPKLSGHKLSFLVAFAEGGMLGTIFLHLLPEIEFGTQSGVYLISGFLAFVGIDKAMRIYAGDENAHGHSHSHSSSSSSEVTPEPAYTSSTSTANGVKNRKQDGGVSEKTLGKSVEQPVGKQIEEEAPSANLSAWLNVIADSLHNITDGISLALSFNNGPVAGFSAFLIMCCHEIPHQFGDFALLINSGASKSSARNAQLVTATGTLLGAFIGNRIGALSESLEEPISAATAGVFLYVATVGVLPEILETEKDASTKSNIYQGVVQLVGIVSGVTILLYLD